MLNGNLTFILVWSSGYQWWILGTQGKGYKRKQQISPLQPCSDLGGKPWPRLSASQRWALAPESLTSAITTSSSCWLSLSAKLYLVLSYNLCISMSSKSKTLTAVKWPEVVFQRLCEQLSCTRLSRPLLGLLCVLWVLYSIVFLHKPGLCWWTNITWGLCTWQCFIVTVC